MTDRECERLRLRMYHLPRVIETAERRLQGLYREAKRYRMNDLLRYPALLNDAWDREVETAKLEAERREGCL